MNAALNSSVCCPSCAVRITSWPQHQLVQCCERCLRPMLMLRVRGKPFKLYRLIRLFAAVRMVLALLASVLLIALVARLLPLGWIVGASVAAFVLQGVTDLADGLLGLRSGHMSSWQRPYIGAAARRQSSIKCAFGLLLIGLALFGLLLM